jgi:hypothetical protein
MNRITETKRKVSVLCRFIIPAIVAVFALSCSSEGDIRQVFTTNPEPPVFLDSQPVSSTEVAFRFSKPVQVRSINFSPELEVLEIKDGAEVIITFAEPLAPGKRITADILVEDSARNTLDVIKTFRARNDRMPVLVFNELRTEFNNPRVEFVEFLALEAGNMGALRLFIAGYSLTRPFYEFPAAEVRAGEYIVLHLRTLSNDSVDETGDDLTLSGGTDASDTGRDFWVPGSAKRLHRTSALWIMNQDDRIIDAVILVENPSDWGRNNTIAAAEFLARNGAWLPADGSPATEGWVPGPADAVRTAGTTATRTINRDQSIPPAPRAGNWYITATGDATPGRENSTRRHTP